MPAVCCFIPVLNLDRLQDFSTRTNSGQNLFQLVFEKCLESVLSVSWPWYLMFESLWEVPFPWPLSSREQELCVGCFLLMLWKLQASTYQITHWHLGLFVMPKTNSSQKNSQACDDFMSLNLQTEASKDISGAQHQSFPQKNTEHVCPWYTMLAAWHVIPALLRRDYKTKGSYQWCTSPNGLGHSAHQYSKKMLQLHIVPWKTFCFVFVLWGKKKSMLSAS